MKHILTIFAVCLFVLSSCTTPKELVILHTNDSHSQIETIRVGKEKGLGGVERRLQVFNSVRKEYGKNNVLILDAGDYNQGTPYFTVANGDLEVELMNALEYDAATMGNHELDNGQEEYARRIANMSVPTLVCNYDFSKTPLAGLVEPYKVFKRAGIKIGVIGVANANLDGLVMASHLDNLTLLNTVEEVNKYAKLLREVEKCDLVIVLSHLGASGKNSDNYLSDDKLAKSSVGLDIIIGGHSHTYMKKAVEITDAQGKKVVVVQAASKGTVVGKFVIPIPVQSLTAE